MEQSSQSYPWFTTDGQVASLMRHMDWSTCAIGKPENWSQQLLTLIGLALHSHSPAAIIWGRELNTFYNDAYAAQLGEKHPASLGQSFSSLWKEIWSEMESVIDGVMGGKSYYFEDTPYTVEPEGVPTQRWYTSSFSPITDSNGNVAGIYIAASETTRRMQSERRYAFQSRLAECLRYLTTSNEIVFATSELLGAYLGVERVMYAVTDNTAETIRIECDWTNGNLQSMAGVVLHLDDFGPSMADAIRAGNVVITSDIASDERSAAYADAYTAQGIRSFVAVPLMREGRLLAILNIHDFRTHYWTEHEIDLARDMVDWTWAAVENALAQAALRTERDRSQAVFHTMTEGFVLIDRHWTVQYMNDEGLRLSGRSASQTIGHHHWEVWSELVGSDPEQLYRRVMATRQPEAMEFVFTYPNGSTAWLELRAYPVMDTGMAVLIRDVSYRREAEGKLLDADRRKDEFLAMLAHELRNPLAPIRAAAELLQLVKLDEGRVKQTSTIIARQVSHMTGLIDDLLDVSRVTRGLIELDKIELDMHQVVHEAVEQVNPLIRTRRHELTIRQTPHSAIVCADKKRLVQVVSNILNNAAKYTPEGGHLTLCTEVLNSQVIIQVIDDGIGMTPEMIKHAFDLFAQAERTSDRSSGGLGLGLALVKSMVELHGGNVTCKSEGMGQGSTFSIWLPLVLEKPHKSSELPTETGLQQERNTSLRILVVDDNVDAAEMLKLFLEAMGHEVLVEHGPYEALKRATLDQPQVFLLDIGLPEIDGNELARRLRAQPENQGVTLVAITGYGQESDRLNALSAGFDYHLVKPVDMKKLVEIFSEINLP